MLNYNFIREHYDPESLHTRTAARFEGDAPKNIHFLNDFMRADLDAVFFTDTIVHLLDSVLRGDISYAHICAGPFDLTIEGGLITVEDIESGLDWNNVTLSVRDFRTFVLEWNRFEKSHSNNGSTT